MEGFWTIRFEGIEGWGSGVITLMEGAVFGGDNGYLYVGSFKQQGNAFSARVHVKAHTAGIANVMGRSEFDLDLTGIDMVGAARPKALFVEAEIPGTDLTLKGTLTKQGDLPVKSSCSRLIE